MVIALVRYVKYFAFALLIAGFFVLANLPQKVPAQTASASLPSNMNLLKKAQDLNPNNTKELKQLKKKLQSMSAVQRTKLLISIKQLAIKQLTEN